MHIAILFDFVKLPVRYFCKPSTFLSADDEIVKTCILDENQKEPVSDFFESWTTAVIHIFESFIIGLKSHAAKVYFNNVRSSLKNTKNDKNW